MLAYFNEFNERMHKRYIILPKLVEKYHDDICILVDIDIALIQVVNPRVTWLEPIKYETNIDQSIEAIEALLSELVNELAKPFDTCKKENERIKLEITTPRT